MPWEINRKEMMKPIFGSVQPKTRHRLREGKIIPAGHVSGICSRSTIKRPYGFAMRPDCIPTNTWMDRFAMSVPGMSGRMRRRGLYVPQTVLGMHGEIPFRGVFHCRRSGHADFRRTRHPVQLPDLRKTLLAVQTKDGGLSEASCGCMATQPKKIIGRPDEYL